MATSFTQKSKENSGSCSKWWFSEAGKFQAPALAPDAITDSEILGQTLKFAFLTSSSVTLMSLVWLSHLENHCSRNLSPFPLSFHPTSKWPGSTGFYLQMCLSLPYHHCSGLSFCHIFLNYYNYLQAGLSTSSLALQYLLLVNCFISNTDQASCVPDECFQWLPHYNWTMFSFLKMACNAPRDLALFTSPFSLSNTPIGIKC